jgi:hypothetical protein
MQNTIRKFKPGDNVVRWTDFRTFLHHYVSTSTSKRQLSVISIRNFTAWNRNKDRMQGSRIRGFITCNLGRAFSTNGVKMNAYRILKILKERDH